MLDRSVGGMGRCKWSGRVPGLLAGALLASLTGPLAAGTGSGAAAVVSNDRAVARYEALYSASKRDALAAATLGVHRDAAIPAFARKYGLPCSACHTAWPELNVFGQRFRDNGYQLMNERDSPIWQNPSYWPATVRITPTWHLESTTHQPTDQAPNGQTITQHGFDLSGMDLWFGGTLYKNISFVVLPSSDETATFHFEAAFVRFDNLWNNRWINFKFGKFELDNMISEKRFLFLSNNGGFYQSYHFLPVGDVNDFGIGDNQIGAELSGHSDNSYTRYGLAVLSSTDGNPGLPGSKGGYDGMFTFSQAFDGGKLGAERIGVFGYAGQRPTNFLTSGGDAIPGTGTDNKAFYRVGVSGDLFLGNLEFMPFYMYSSDDKYLATGTPVGGTLPAGARNATWNSYFLETHYYFNPQFVLTQRDEFVRMSKQADPATPSTLGNIDAYSFGFRYYPIMFSRAGLALHGELSVTKTIGNVPGSGDGSGVPPVSASTAVWSTSVLMAMDFDF